MHRVGVLGLSIHCCSIDRPVVSQASSPKTLIHHAPCEVWPGNGLDNILRFFFEGVGFIVCGFEPDIDLNVRTFLVHVGPLEAV